jgi:Cof subfamily protein (haloacid dehalogenase superfamily)
MSDLYVSDLDGTLLNTKDVISPTSIEIINRLVDAGMLFTYATARSLSSASVVTKGLTTKIPVIAYNGAIIFEPDTGKILSLEDFSHEERSDVREILTSSGISPVVYSFVDGVEKVSWDQSQENDGKKRYFQNRIGDRRLRPLERREGLYDGNIFYYTCIGEKDELEPIYEIFSRDPRYTCTLQQELYRPEYWCEIMPQKATKFHAILKLKELWHCDRVISFGDSINDIPMFKISDERYAVANAAESLKAIATGVIGDNNSDSVAGWLEKHARLEDRG